MDPCDLMSPPRAVTPQSVLIEDPGPNPLEEYFAKNNGRLIHKWVHYFEIYHRHFHAFRGRPITVIEFGVYQGGSLQMWKHYFGEQARIVGVDIDPRCKEFEEPQIEIHIGDQANSDFLRQLTGELGPIDIVIDDGGHTMTQQITTFEGMFPAIRLGGIYLVEDLHTSYWKHYGGGLRQPATFVEYVKGLVDHLHAWHFPDETELEVTYYTRHIRAMHLYDSVFVFDKGVVNPPSVHKTGGNPS
jgi:23S rRNA U2552 (ribose-2'-O)-methylase RlmE/FtsJ